ncbi:hypothetical protein HPB50_020453 [Hyalomma asiaticum]|uniref:Uncharacterized protein n=1 Tax=Hyalomma asiaticum TaxID=266040 RepID=A0ACB7S556_HYAAI|nr:hypothetical protein HPB50_020453 [Hyalomma asiaticum]
MGVRSFLEMKVCAVGRRRRTLPDRDGGGKTSAASLGPGLRFLSFIQGGREGDRRWVGKHSEGGDVFALKVVVRAHGRSKCVRTSSNLDVACTATHPFASHVTRPQLCPRRSGGGGLERESTLPTRGARVHRLCDEMPDAASDAAAVTHVATRDVPTSDALSGLRPHCSTRSG